MRSGILIINFKNYGEILGERSVELAKESERVAAETGVEVVVAPPAPLLHTVARSVRIPVFSQKLDAAEVGKSTGALVPEAVKASGCRGSIINHSESRVGPLVAKALLERMRAVGLSACLCAESVEEVRVMAGLAPDYLAIEPPELIGSGRAVSTARPELVSMTVEAAKQAGYGGMVLCGAGIVGGEDVAAARRLGMDGVLVSSSVVRAASWSQKVSELASRLV